MKQLIIFLSICFLSPELYGQLQAQPQNTEEPKASIDPKKETDAARAKSEAKSLGYAEEFISNVHDEIVGTGNLKADIQSYESSLASVTSIMQIQSNLGFLQNLSKKYCQTLSEESGKCCNNPESKCAGSSLSKLARGSGGVLAIGAVAGALDKKDVSMGAAGSCLKLMPGLIEVSGIAKGNIKACKYLREGVTINSKSYPGCKKVCKDLDELADQTKSAINSIGGQSQNPQEQALIPNLLSQVDQIQTEILQEGKQTCLSETGGGEKKANNQASSIDNTMLSNIVECVEAILNGDKKDDPEAVAEQKPGGYESECIGGNCPDGYGNTGIGDISTPSFGPSVDSASIPDDAIGSNGSGDNANSGAGNGGGTGRGYPGGGFAGGTGGGVGGLGGSSNKASDGGGRGPAESRKLIAGHQTAKGSGSGGVGSGTGSSGTGLKPFSFKKNNYKGKPAKAALVKKLSKSGISMDVSEHIFTRITKAVQTHGPQKKLLDCKPNKKNWMDK